MKTQELQQSLSDILEKVDDVVVDYLIPNAKKWDTERAFPRENLAALGEEGLLGLMIPKSLEEWEGLLVYTKKL
ncbi:acyl-CoA dehydrogenase family protein [Ectobacillus funiculus]